MSPAPESSSSADPSNATRDLLRHGVVLSRDASGAVVDMGDGLVLGPMGWSAARAGKLKIYAPPSEGEQVEVLAPEGDLERAYISRSLFSDANPTPATDDSTRIEWDDGTSIVYDAGVLELDVVQLARVKAPKVELAAPDIDITGKVKITGDVDLTGKLTATGDIKAGPISLQNHPHAGTNSPAPAVGKPLP